MSKILMYRHLRKLKLEACLHYLLQKPRKGFNMNNPRRSRGTHTKTLQPAKRFALITRKAPRFKTPFGVEHLMLIYRRTQPCSCIYNLPIYNLQMLSNLCTHYRIEKHLQNMHVSEIIIIDYG